MCDETLIPLGDPQYIECPVCGQYDDWVVFMYASGRFEEPWWDVSCGFIMYQYGFSRDNDRPEDGYFESADYHEFAVCTECGLVIS